MAEHIHDVVDDDEITFCTVHPDRETRLRCNKCDRLMCTQCAVKTAVGYRCRDCVRTQQDKFFEATPQDYAITFGVAFAISVVLGYLTQILGGFLMIILYAVLIAPAVGSIIHRIVLRLTNKRRGRQTGLILVIAIVVGFMVPHWQVIRLVFVGLPVGDLLLYLLWPAVYAAITASVAYGWTRTGGPSI